MTKKSDFTLVYEMEKAFEWRKWIDEIPYLSFASDWLVKAIPPYLTGIVRYHVTKAGKKDQVSIYLDCYELAGFYGGEPHWEIYSVDGENVRCAMKDTDQLMKYIGIAVSQLRSAP